MRTGCYLIGSVRTFLHLCIFASMLFILLSNATANERDKLTLLFADTSWQTYEPIVRTKEILESSEVRDYLSKNGIRLECLLIPPPYQTETASVKTFEKYGVSSYPAFVLVDSKNIL